MILKQSYHSTTNSFGITNYAIRKIRDVLLRPLSYHIKEWEESGCNETVAEAAANGLLFEAVENLIQETED
jgi:hypothetical protein